MTSAGMIACLGAACTDEFGTYASTVAVHCVHHKQFGCLVSLGAAASERCIFFPFRDFNFANNKSKPVAQMGTY